MENMLEQNVTQLLKAWSGGDKDARDQLFSVIYPYLRKRAGAYMWRERPDHTLQPTALINEAYIKLADQRELSWENREHFFKLASKVMRQVLIDHAREKRAGKRGGGQEYLPLDEAIARGEERDFDLVMLDEALAKYEKVDPRRSELVELHYFGGFSNEDIAEMLKVSDSTVKRDLRTARAWLRRQIG